jgi:hypothetical protein
MDALLVYSSVNRAEVEVEVEAECGIGLIDFQSVWLRLLDGR